MNAVRATTLSRGGEALFGRVPVWLNALGGSLLLIVPSVLGFVLRA
ncbi:hypothetical protein [Planotetraspora sp. GP83]